MSIGSKKLLSMDAQIVRGVQKAESHLVTDDESSAKWDELAAEHESLKSKHPGIGFAIPNDPDLL